MRRGSMPMEPSSTLMFWSSTICGMFAPLSNASTAVISTASLVRTISRMILVARRIAGRAVAQISEQLDLAPSARDGVEHEPARESQQRRKHQAGRQDRSWETRHRPGLDKGNEDRDRQPDRYHRKRNGDRGEER